MAGVRVGWQQGDDKPHLAKEQHGPSRHRTQCNGCVQWSGHLVPLYGANDIHRNQTPRAQDTARHASCPKTPSWGAAPPPRLWQ
eukprot:gene14223-biopygen3580